MSKEPTKFEINGRVYIITDWQIDKQLETFVWLTKTFGEGLLTLFMTEGGLDGVDNLLGNSESELTDEEKKEKSKKDLDGLTDVVKKVTSNLEGKEYVKYVKIMLDGISCKAKSVSLMDFTGRIGELHQVIFHCLRHQYGDFLDGKVGEDQ